MSNFSPCSPPPSRSLPTLLGACLLALALALIFGATIGSGTAAAAQCKGASTPAYEMSSGRASKVTFCLLNKERRARGLGKLKNNKDQKRAAKRHNRAMIKKGCFDHICPGENDLIDRILDTAYLPCNCSWGVAENIAYGFGNESSPRKVVAAWMRSAGHRANILNGAYKHIGIAVARGVPGNRKSDGATYTTDFGYRR